MCIQNLGNLLHFINLVRNSNRYICINARLIGIGQTALKHVLVGVLFIYKVIKSHNCLTFNISLVFSVLDYH